MTETDTEYNPASLKRARFTPSTKDVGTFTKDNDRYVRVPISSTGDDRDGDTFSEKGLEDLRDQINEGTVPMFENHGGGGGLFGGPRYATRDMIGGWKSAEIKDGVLIAEAKLRSDSEAADEIHSLVNDEMPVGWSIGFRGLESDDRKDADGREFHKADLLETSSVGIPSNPDGVANAAALAKTVASAVDGDVDEQKLADALKTQMTPSEADADASASQDETSKTSEPSQTDDPDETSTTAFHTTMSDQKTVGEMSADDLKRTIHDEVQNALLRTVPTLLDGAKETTANAVAAEKELEKQDVKSELQKEIDAMREELNTVKESETTTVDDDSPAAESEGLL